MPGVRGKKNKLRPGVYIGHWFLIERIPRRSNRMTAFWLCRCTGCDRLHRVRSYNLRKGLTNHCRHCNEGRPSKTPAVHIGDKIGWWTVLAEAESARDELGRKKHRNLLVRCKCGVEKVKRLSTIALGRSLSCGCGRGYFLAVTVMARHQAALDEMKSELLLKKEAA